MNRVLDACRLSSAIIAVVAVLTSAAPPSAEAQQAGKIHRISFLGLTPGEDTTSMKPLLERLHELSYSEGKNMTFEYRSAEGRAERLPQLATELVRARPDVLITGFGTLTAQAAKAATTTIPVVFTLVGDPVGAGLVASLGRTGDDTFTPTGQAVVDHFESGFGEDAYVGHAFSLGVQLIREGDGPLRGEGRGQID